MKTVNIEALVADFAKANKISKAKVSEFANLVASRYKSTGRPVSGKTVELRQRLKEYVSSKEQFTSKEIATALNCEPVEVNNALHYLAKTEKCVVQNGYLKGEKTRGRPQILWTVAK